MDQLQLKSLVRVKKHRVLKCQMGRAAPNILTRDFAAAGHLNSRIDELPPYRWQPADLDLHKTAAYSAKHGQGFIAGHLQGVAFMYARSVLIIKNNSRLI